ncbi:MAG: hypothetical protein EA343_14385 [Nodularia sp. (in: Bacteria)]|jgi:hypothetical protein|nr:MAG: hypothetical protein EA343_14385 [Nodularia sp. (in: cyanobacteria)]
MPDKYHTGTNDEHFNLVSVLYHALQGAACCETYLNDAEQAGDRDLTQFFQDVKKQNQNLAERAKQLLAQRTEQLVAH